MDINYGYVEPKEVRGKIFLTCFPGRENKKILFKESIFLTDLDNFISLGCNTILSLVEESEFDKLCDKKSFAEPMGNLHLEDIENPYYAGPEPWLYSLAYQQFTPEEIENGRAVEILIDKGFL